MVINARYRFVFVHNPKCGGTAIRASLATLGGPATAYWGYARSLLLQRWIDRAHVPLDDLAWWRPLAYWRLRNWFSFAFVRHPWRRFLSALHEHELNHRRHLPGEARPIGADPAAIERFVLVELAPGLARRQLAYTHFFPQHWFTHHGATRMIELIGRQERLEEDLRGIWARLGLSGAPPLRPQNTAGERRTFPADGGLGPDLADLTLATRRALARLYARDFDLFGYAPDTPKA